MASTKDREPPGLKSIHEARAQRERRQSRVTPQQVLFVLLTAVTVLVIYKYVAGHNLDAAKDKLLQKQRAVQATVGAEWTPLRDRLEKIALEDAAAFRGDFVDPEGAKWDFRALPGVYLRMRVADARDVASLRRAAQRSARDAFAGCLLREPNAPAAKGLPDAGAFSEQPWNLRQGYAATRILTDDWVREVNDADDDLRLRVFEQQYDKAIRDEIPLAIDFIKRAQFFLLVLDEDDDAARALTDGGAISVEALELVPHETRVHLVNMRTQSEVFRLKRAGHAQFYMAGERPGVDPETKAAMQRNVNNCDLASQVQAALAEKKSPAEGPARDK